MHDLNGGRHSDVRTGRGSRSRLLHSVYDMPSANPNPSVTGHGRPAKNTGVGGWSNSVPLLAVIALHHAQASTPSLVRRLRREARESWEAGTTEAGTDGGRARRYS
jgi:hypothetical protein